MSHISHRSPFHSRPHSERRLWHLWLHFGNMHVPQRANIKVANQHPHDINWNTKPPVAWKTCSPWGSISGFSLKALSHGPIMEENSSLCLLWWINQPPSQRASFSPSTATWEHTTRFIISYNYGASCSRCPTPRSFNFSHRILPHSCVSFLSRHMSRLSADVGWSRKENTGMETTLG